MRFALGVVLVYQLASLYRHDDARRPDTDRALKALLRVARGYTTTPQLDIKRNGASPRRPARETTMS